MKQLVATIIFIANVTFVFGQLPSELPNDISKTKNDLPDKIKTILQYQDDSDFLLNVRTYDTLKKIVFSYYKQYVSEYWNGKYITMITGNIYDNYGKIIKSYDLHSNAGLSICYYEYDSFGNQIKSYIKNNDYEKHDSLINQNPYYYISDIRNINGLINHPKIEEIELVAKKYLLRERTFDSIGNIIEEVSYEENGDTSAYQKYEYDENNNKIYFYNEWAKSNQWEYYYEYEKKYSFFGEDSQTKSKRSNLLQSVRIDYDWREKRKRISDITLYKYDNEDRLTEKILYCKGEFREKHVYEYNNLNRETKRIWYDYNPDKIVLEKTYLYNKEGNVIEEIVNDSRTREKKVYKYRYEYEYYE